MCGPKLRHLRPTLSGMMPSIITLHRLRAVFFAYITATAMPNRHSKTAALACSRSR
jgi:hypothetical protein